MKTVQEFFANVVSNNPELKAQIDAARNSADVVRLAAAAGYALTEEAVISFITRAGQSEELSDSDLASVAGGQKPERPITSPITNGTVVTRCCW